MTLSKKVPWTEKHRPKTLSEIASQKESVAVLKKIVSTKNLPHMLFYGPAGTGKTSAILAMAREMYGSKLMKQRVLELNASDERGIDVIRNKIKNFARLAICKTDENVPPYKIIVLDEADWMTSDAQNALRRIMEKYAAITRFCLICNYVSRIIAPIASRCSKFNFKPLREESVTQKLHDICHIEKINLDRSVLRAVYEVTGGDLRRGVTLLQSAKDVFGELTTTQDIEDLSLKVPEGEIETIIKTCETENFDDIKLLAERLVLDSRPARQLVTQLTLKIAQSSLHEEKKSKIILKLSTTEWKLGMGADQVLQLQDAFSFINTVLLN